MWLRTSDAGGHQSKERGFYAALDRVYGRMLHWTLRHRFVMLLIAVAVSASAVWLFPRMGKELVPDDDQSEFAVSVNLPRGTAFSVTEQYLKDVEPMLLSLPNVTGVFTNLNTNSGNWFVSMVPLEQRKDSQQDMMRQVRNLMRQKYPGLRTSVSGGTDISGASTAGGGPGGGGPGRGGPGGGGGNRLSILIQGPDIDQLQVYLGQVIDRLKKVPGFVEVDTNFEATQQELRVETDRVRAADLGVNLDTLAGNLRTLVAGEQVSRFRDGDLEDDVTLRLDEQFREPTKLGELMIAAGGAGNANGLGTPGGPRAVHVSDVANLRLDRGPADISRYNRQRQITVNAGFDKIPLGEAVTRARQAIDELNLKPG